jgi:hypothetical protein
LAASVDFIEFNENAKTGGLVFSANNSSSARADADDEDYDFSASSELATHSATRPVAVAWDKWVDFDLQRRGISMRRLMSLLVASMFLASLAGCCCHSQGCGRGFSQGICDCEADDHCLERAPWLRFGAARESEAIQAPPTKMPDGKKL